MYQIGRFYLRTSETSQKRLKYVRVIDVPIEKLWWNLSMIQDAEISH